MIARELAEALDCSEATVSRWLSGDRRPSIERLADVKTVLGWSIDDQVEALEHGRYAAELKARMDRQPTEQDTPADPRDVAPFY